MARSARFYKWVAIVSVAALGANGVATANLYQHNSAATLKAAELIRRGQIQNCHLIGEPVRIAEIAVLHGLIGDTKGKIADVKHEITQSKSFDYHKLFPNFPPKRLHALIREQRDRNLDTIASERGTVDVYRSALAPLVIVPPCEQRYPPVS